MYSHGGFEWSSCSTLHFPSAKLFPLHDFQKRDCRFRWAYSFGIGEVWWMRIANYGIFLDVFEFLRFGWLFPFFKKIWFLGILGPPYCGIGNTIRIGRKLLCLPYAGFLLYVVMKMLCSVVYYRGPLHYVFKSIVALHSFRLKLCSINCSVLYCR